MALKTIPLTSVRIGMYLCGIDRPWMDTPFLRHRFPIKSSSDIDKLHACGVREITIDTQRGLDVLPTTEELAIEEEGDHHPASPSKEAPQVFSIPPEVQRIQNLPGSVRGKSLAGELTSTKMTQRALLESVTDILQTLSKTGGVEFEEVQQITRSIMAETLNHEEAYIDLIRSREFTPALHDHALAVSTLAVLLGRSMGLEETTLQHLASAGLLHDVGLIKIPQSLHRPINQLSESELGIYVTHPIRGIEFLSQQSSLPEEVEIMIREHHVAGNGAGYPTTIPYEEIQIPSRILRIVDEYEELLSGHQTGSPLSIRNALQTLYQQGNRGTLDKDLVANFISLIGIYPTYSLVELSTGERGIITGNSSENLLQPTILLIQDAEHQPLPEPIPFNFGVLSSQQPSPEIVHVLAPEEVGVQLPTVLEDWVSL